MTLHEAAEIFGYWAQNPPAHLMVQIIARALGWTPAIASPGAGDRDIAASAPPGLAVSAGGIDMPPPQFDPDAMQRRNRERAVAIARRNARSADAATPAALPQTARPA